MRECGGEDLVKILLCRLMPGFSNLASKKEAFQPRRTRAWVFRPVPIISVPRRSAIVMRSVPGVYPQPNSTHCEGREGRVKRKVRLRAGVSVSVLVNLPARPSLSE